MKCTVTISYLKEYDSAGAYEGERYEISIDEDGFVQNIFLSDESELLTLRNALSAYINTNNPDSINNEE